MDIESEEYEVYRMVTLIELCGITPDKYNDDPVLYHEDIIDIFEAKKLIARGDEKRRRRDEARRRAHSKSRK